MSVKSINFRCLTYVFITQLIILPGGIKQAQAGEFEQTTNSTNDQHPLPEEIQDNNYPNESIEKKTYVLDWEKWSPPYWSNNQVCRESMGNTICFSQDAAQKLRWRIP